MPGATLLAVAAVLAGDRLVFADTVSATVLRQVVLPGAAAALFAAPDGRVVLPLAASDETVLASLTGPTERWPGRIFPMFFDESDRMYVVFPELLLALSYPERLPLLRVQVPGVAAPWRAACSSNGLLVAVSPPPGERRVVMIVAEPGALQREVGLADEPRFVAMSPDGSWLAAGFEDAVEIAFAGEPNGRGRVPVGAGVRALAVASDGSHLLVGLAGGKGSLAILRVSTKLDTGAKTRDEIALPGAVTSVAVGGPEVVVIAGDRLLILDKKGRNVARELPVPGARQVVLLPAQPETTSPQWSTP